MKAYITGTTQGLGKHVKSILTNNGYDVQLCESECKVTLIKPGRMKTQMTDHRDEYFRMSPAYVGRTILFALEQPKDIIIKSITVDVHNSNRKIK